MSLKRRLIISNAAIVIIPILITIVASLIFIFITSVFFKEDISFESVKKLTETNIELFNADGKLLQKGPEMLKKKENQQNLMLQLEAINSELIILKGQEIYFSSFDISRIDAEKCLDAAKRSFFSNSIEINGIKYIFKVSSSIKFKDGEQGKTIILVSVGKGGFAEEVFILFVFGVFVISFSLTNFISAYLFSHSILKPLGRLKKASGEISNGRLDYEVVEEGDMEIRELFRSFEQMRLKLKESVHTQMKFDDNRKMLVSSISHDLKTPITSIKGYVEGIMDGVANTPEKIEKYLETIYSKAVQVDAMIDDLLLYSKLDLNQIPFNFETTDIVSYFADCISEGEHELQKAGIKISLLNELNGSRKVLVDRERLRRVITNIIDNARKYMDKSNGEIAITLRETKLSIVIELYNNGAGIPKEDLPNIFDRFYRGDISRSKISGSGLGLAIAKQIVEGHGGEIWARTHEKEGTSIMISLKKFYEPSDQTPHLT
jgi:signal transduction histidine kinase